MAVSQEYHDGVYMSSCLILHIGCVATKTSVVSHGCPNPVYSEMQGSPTRDSGVEDEPISDTSV